MTSDLRVAQYVDSGGNIIHRDPVAQASIEADDIAKQPPRVHCRYIVPTSLGIAYQTRAEIEAHFAEDEPEALAARLRE